MGPSSALGHHDTAAGRPLGVTQRGSGFANRLSKMPGAGGDPLLGNPSGLKQAASLAEVERREASWGPRLSPFPLVNLGPLPAVS